MDSNSSNHSFTNVPQINLQSVDSMSLSSNSLNTKLSQIEMNCKMDEQFFNSDVELETNKLDNKPRSYSMVSDQFDRKDIDIITRNRAGSMFIPNYCVHCKMLEEMQFQHLETVRNYVSEEDLPLSSLEDISLVSSNSSSPSNSSPRNSIENDNTQFCFTKEFGQFLEVPKWKPRASSLDSGIFHNDRVTNQSRRASFEEVLNSDKPRATSVDVHMQCLNMNISSEECILREKGMKSKTRFSIVSVSSRQTISRVIKKLKSSKFHLSLSESKSKIINYCSQWNNYSRSKEHIWYPDNSLRQRCSLFDCTQYNATETFKCSACKTVSCSTCKSKIIDTCRKTFHRDSEDLEMSKELNQMHHWVHKTRHKGICKSCSKNMSSQSIFLNKQTVTTLQCSWCKISYHNKKACFSASQLTEQCHFGSLKDSIVFPAMIEKLSNPKYIYENHDEKSDNEEKMIPFSSFSIKGFENMNFKFSKPILALINPKSGGRQGLDILNELQWILNPRQVFDINTFSPENILTFFQPLPNLRILIGGGDGTINWILRAVESSLEDEYTPPIAVIPIGTGNDLARELNWGSSYCSNDSASKIVADMENGTQILIDIWKISAHTFVPENVSSQTMIPPSLSSKLPMDSFNNYFSLGSDAATALEFHLGREKNPSKYNSRIKNKLCYAEIGSKDLWKREYKNLVDRISLVCDGVSFQSRLADLRPHCILFLNITNYSAGTNPWGKYVNNSNFVAQSINDRILEVVGLSAASLATLHIGGQGDRICQCKCAEIEIKRDTPIQIDGEPMLLKPCSISISHKHQYPFIKRECRK